MAAPPTYANCIDCVVIGRNEGGRLVECLASLKGQFRQIVYVDSGSTDGSLRVAAQFGVKAVALDMSLPFTAARARNAGLAALGPEVPDFVQVIDGDCTLQGTWSAAGCAFLEAHPKVAVVCGQRHERHPEKSLYNRLCAREWATPIGRTNACGGDAILRFKAVLDVGGYRDDLIAGEEPELCVRLRAAGWDVWRLDEDMTLHDANITRFGQWVRRTMRAGHAFAEGADLHGAAPERHWVTETRRAIGWGLVLPLVSGLTAAVHPAGLLLLVAYPLQMARIARREDLVSRQTWEFAAMTTLGKIPEAAGVLRYYLGRFRRRKSALVEYK